MYCTAPCPHDPGPEAIIQQVRILAVHTQALRRREDQKTVHEL